MSEEITDGTPAADDGYATFDDLTADTSADAVGETREVVLSGGRKVLLRGLSRYALQQAGKGTDNSSLIEARNLAHCMIRPRLTVEQALAWLKRARAGGDVPKVTNVIRELSGLAEGADKSDV